MPRNLPFTAITDASGLGKTSVIKVRNIYPDAEGIPCNQKTVTMIPWQGCVKLQLSMRG